MLSAIDKAVRRNRRASTFNQLQFTFLRTGHPPSLLLTLKRVGYGFEPLLKIEFSLKCNNRSQLPHIGLSPLTLAAGSSIPSFPEGTTITYTDDSSARAYVVSSAMSGSVSGSSSPSLPITPPLLPVSSTTPPLGAPLLPLNNDLVFEYLQQMLQAR